MSQWEREFTTIKLIANSLRKLARRVSPSPNLSVPPCLCGWISKMLSPPTFMIYKHRIGIVPIRFKFMLTRWR